MELEQVWMGPRVALDGLLEVPNIALDGRWDSLCGRHGDDHINVNLERDRDVNFMNDDRIAAK